MGCKGSKDAKKDDKKIEYDFKSTYLTKFDQLFEEARIVLEKCEKIRHGVEDTHEEGKEIAGTEKLKDPRYIETLRVLLWSLSAQGKGKIVDVGVKATSDKPYLDIDKSKLNHESVSLYDGFKEYVDTVHDSPDVLETSIKKLEELAETATEAAKNIKEEIEGAGLGLKEKLEASVRVSKNSQLLAKQIPKVKKLPEIIKEAALDIKEIVPKLPELVAHADVVGKPAFDAGLFKPKEIFEKFHDGEREGQEKKLEKEDEKKAAENKSPEKAEEKPAEQSPQKPAEQAAE